jgi:2-amino-4-hydroxy-6-hydroxymethyldihydropteridine diphosphokinase
LDSNDDRFNTAYLSLGSNIEPEINLTAAVELLAAQAELVTISSVWETKPVGFTNQANFLNAAAIVKTEFSAAEFKQNVLRPIEQKLRRKRNSNKNGPRTIDLDIVLFNGHVFKPAHNYIPDPNLYKYPFVAVPLAEIAPNYRHPETGQTLRDIAGKFINHAAEMRLRPDVSVTLKAVISARFVQTRQY